MTQTSQVNRHSSKSSTAGKPAVGITSQLDEVLAYSRAIGKQSVQFVVKWSSVYFELIQVNVTIDVAFAEMSQLQTPTLNQKLPHCHATHILFPDLDVRYADRT